MPATFRECGFLERLWQTACLVWRSTTSAYCGQFVVMGCDIQDVPKLFVQINTRGREHRNKYISIRNIWSLKSICNVREHFGSGADVSCCVGVADWECVLTFKTSLMCAWKHTYSVAISSALWQQQWTWSSLRMLKWLTFIWYTGLWMEMAPAQFSIAVRKHLRATVGNRWIGRGSPVAWPPWSPDLTYLDYFLWGHMDQRCTKPLR